MQQNTTNPYEAGKKSSPNKKVAAIGGIILATVAVFAIAFSVLGLLIPSFWPYQCDKMLGNEPMKLPDSSYLNLAPFEYGDTEQKRIAEGELLMPHILGTDSFGRDIFVRTVYGAQRFFYGVLFASIVLLLVSIAISCWGACCSHKAAAPGITLE